MSEPTPFQPVPRQPEPNASVPPAPPAYPVTAGGPRHAPQTHATHQPQPAPQAAYPTASAYTPSIQAQTIQPQTAAVQQPPAGRDTGSIGWGILGFLFPVIGLILYLVWKDTKPQDARIAGKGALVSVIVSVILLLIGFLLLIGIGITAAGSGGTSL